MNRKPGRPKGSGTRSLSERFKKFVERGEPDECWLWVGSTSKDGHGRVWDGETVIPAHHGAYILAHGERVPRGMYLRRTCNKQKLGTSKELRKELRKKQKLCMNPAHFVLRGTKRSEENA